MLARLTPSPLIEHPWRLGSTTRLSLYWTLYLFRPTNRRCKNVAARTHNIASGENPDFIDHCGRSILYGSYGGGIQNMVIETVLFIAFVVAGGAVIVNAYERHQDVLYGPYMKRAD